MFDHTAACPGREKRCSSSIERADDGVFGHRDLLGLVVSNEQTAPVAHRCAL
jgi:hypothetical protein